MNDTDDPSLPSKYTRTYGGNKAFHNFANDYSHISDPNLRRRLALSEIDKTPFGLYHVRAVLVAGVGFFLDSYDIFAINMVVPLLGLALWAGPTSVNNVGGNEGKLPGPVNTALKTSTSAGIIVGQVLFGYLADRIGRRRMYGAELGIILISTLNCALVGASPAISTTSMLVFWRVVMGVGIGGDYPLSSVITSEFAPTRWRGAMMACVFSMQGMGQLTCALVALVVTVAFRPSFELARNPAACEAATCGLAADRSWRIILAFGALPAAFALYYRITIPETPRYTFDVAHDVEKADADIKAYQLGLSDGVVDPVTHARMLKVAGPALTVPSASWTDVFSYFGEWKKFKVLLGTTLSWFFLDLAFYGLGLNNTIVLETMGFSEGRTVFHTLHNNAVGMIILTCAGSLPGYWAAVATVDTLGRKPLQFFGFLVLTVIFAVLGFCFHHLSEQALLGLYVAAQFFFNWGPNTTTFMVPGECFPTRYRSTAHGVSAAMGKLGAILAQLISMPFTKTGSAGQLDRLMQIFSLFMLCGTFTTLLIPETKGVTLEELAGEPPTRAGRNGSVGARRGDGHDGKKRGPGFLGRLNPFAGGQPAGFLYPRVRRGSTGTGSSRVGIMTSPDMVVVDVFDPTGTTTRRPSADRGWASRFGSLSSRTGSKRSRGRSASSRSCSTDPEEDDRVPISSASTVPLPGWSAGWGAGVDGGQADSTSPDTIRLHDVGTLLR